MKDLTPPAGHAEELREIITRTSNKPKQKQKHN